jgi:hypothetical protein
MNSMVHNAAAPLLALLAAVSLGMGMAGPAAVSLTRAAGASPGRMP